MAMGSIITFIVGVVAGAFLGFMISEWMYKRGITFKAGEGIVKQGMETSAQLQADLVQEAMLKKQEAKEKIEGVTGHQNAEGDGKQRNSEQI